MIMVYRLCLLNVFAGGRAFPRLFVLKHVVSKCANSYISNEASSLIGVASTMRHSGQVLPSERVFQKFAMLWQ